MAKTTTLVEREKELARLDALLERARTGVGGTVLVEGPPGIGKSSLLLQTRRRAAESGAQVFWARGAELEQQSAFGVIRQLFALALARSPEQRRRAVLSGSAGLTARALRLDADHTGEPPTGVSEIDVHHGLYWLCSNLADDGTVVIAVDDAQWADLPSLHWIGYLSRRLEDLAVLLVVAIATPVRDRMLVPLAELRADPNTVALRPGPLSQGAVADVVYGIYGKEPEEEFARASTGEIAQALFVSRKTVEKHLGQAYSKLGVHTREELQQKAGKPRRTALGLVSIEPSGSARVVR